MADRKSARAPSPERTRLAVRQGKKPEREKSKEDKSKQSDSQGKRPDSGFAEGRFSLDNLVSSQNSLDDLSRQFVTIPLGDYSQCQAFGRKHPEIWEKVPREFAKAAQDALLAQNKQLAHSCLQKSFLLLKSEDYKSKAAFFEDLTKRKSVAKDFEEQVLDSLEKLETRVAGILRIEHERRASESARDRQLSQPTGGTSYTDASPRASFGRLSSVSLFDNPNAGLQPAQPRLHQDPVSQVNQPPRTHRRGTGSHFSNVPSLLVGPTGGEEVMDHRYSLHPSKCYVVGFVFATVWHASFGSNSQAQQDLRMREGRFGEKIISHIQRMVVVKEEYGSSWCCPVNTYRGQGVEKFADGPPISAENKNHIAAHAILYMSNSKPCYGENEPEMLFEPIKVEPSSPDQKLDQMSRVNFAKVHTFEHNVKSMSVGMIKGDSLAKFKKCWRSIADERMTRSQRARREI